ncbi:hypothetical protein Q7P37_010828 [Cladosporium fusiforme]
MAEVAAGVWAAEEVVSTTAQVGVAAYMVSQPTMPLKGTFGQIATAPDDHTRLSLARSNHSLTIVGDKAYIFGGEVGEGELATTDIHVISLLSSEKAEKEGVPQYSLLQSLPAGATGGEASGVRDDNSDGIPAARTRHAACAFNVCTAVFGGADQNGEVIDEKGRIWLYNTAKSSWEFIGPKLGEQDVPEPRSEGKLFECDNDLVLHGGFNKSGEPLVDTWHFSYANKTWTRLPDAPKANTNISLANGILWLIALTPENNGLNGHIYSLPISQAASTSKPTAWTVQSFPTNPLTPSPAPRVAGGLLPITTGHGRHYLLQLFGVSPPSQTIESLNVVTPSETTSTEEQIQSQPSEPTQYPDLWTLQLPSTTPGRKASWSETLRPAALKDSIRSAFKANPGTNAWAEVDVQPPALEKLGDGQAGKVHPGPRAWFGSDVLKDGKTVMIWGGVNAKGEREGDGWLVGLE